MSFDVIAPCYRGLEWVTAGSLLQQCRIAFLHQIKDARHILLLGEGRGRFLFELFQRNPEARITCVDASARMLELMQADMQKRGIPLKRSVGLRCPPSEVALLRRVDVQPTLRSSDGLRVDGVPPGSWPEHGTSGSGCSPTPRVRFVHADVLGEEWGRDSRRYDAIVSHFFLDCFPPDQLARVCERVSASAESGATWLISDFCEPESGWRRVRARWILALLYGFFRTVTRLSATRLTSPDACLKQAGFELRCRKDFNHGLLRSDLWKKL